MTVYNFLTICRYSHSNSYSSSLHIPYVAVHLIINYISINIKIITFTFDLISFFIFKISWSESTAPSPVVPITTTTATTGICLERKPSKASFNSENKQLSTVHRCSSSRSHSWRITITILLFLLNNRNSVYYVQWNPYLLQHTTPHCLSSDKDYCEIQEGSFDNRDAWGDWYFNLTTLSIYFCYSFYYSFIYLFSSDTCVGLIA